MKQNVYTRSIDLSKIDKPLVDYDVNELVAYICNTYKGDPIGAINLLKSRNEISYVRAEKAKIIMEGILG